MSIKPLKPKKCRWCRDPFQPANSMQIVCDYKCAIKLAESTRVKREVKVKRTAQREAKQRITDSDRPYWIKRAQTAFNAWIRQRDTGLPCISCGVADGKGKRNAGHYRPAGVNTALRFEPDNCHGQCERCNTSLSGNLIPYRKGLLLKIGAERLEWLESNHDIKRWSIDDLKAIEAEYKAKLRELRIPL